MDYRLFGINQDFMVDERHHQDLVQKSQREATQYEMDHLRVEQRKGRGNQGTINKNLRKWNIILSRKYAALLPNLRRLKPAKI